MSETLRLSQKAFECGVVFWDGQPGLVVQPMSRGPSGVKEPVCDYLLHPRGTLVPNLPPGERTVRLGFTQDAASKHLPEIGWIYHNEHGVAIDLWRYKDKARDHYRNCLGYGGFHRLVIHTPNLDFPKGVVFWSRSLVIRLTETFTAHRVHRNTVFHESLVQGPQLHGLYNSPHITTGRFVEVIAGTPVSAAAFANFDARRAFRSAESQAQAGWALAILNLGDNARGYEIAHSESLLAYPGNPLETIVKIQVHKPLAVAEVAVNLLEKGFKKLVGSSGSVHLETALNWYLNGTQRTNSRDSLLAYFIGIEVVVRDHANAVELKAEAAKVAQDPQFEELLEPLLATHSKASVQKLIERSQRNEPSVTECFDRYAKDHGLEDIERTRFRRIRKMRNPATHGGGGGVSEVDAKVARSLLERILASELETTAADHR